MQYNKNQSQVELRPMENQLSYDILYIEDDSNYQNKVKDTLESYSFKVNNVTNFDQAKAEISLRHFDAILLEYRLSTDNITGLEFLEEVRKYNQNVTTVFLTDSVDQDIVIRAIRLNVDDFLPKTVNLQTLPELLTTRIEKRKKLFQLPPRVEKTEEIQIKGNLFKNFLILKGSIPLFIIGDWNDESPNDKNVNDSLSDNEFLMSGFLSAIQNFSSNYFGQTVDEISLAKSKLVLLSKDEFTTCLKIENHLYKAMYNIKNKRILINTLERILGEVISFASNQNEKTLLDSTKNHINHILTESSILTQIKTQQDKTVTKSKIKKSYLKRFRDSIANRKKN